MACPGGENRWRGREAVFKMAMTEFSRIKVIILPRKGDHIGLANSNNK